MRQYGFVALRFVESREALQIGMQRVDMAHHRERMLIQPGAFRGREEDNSLAGLELRQEHVGAIHVVV